MNASEYRLIIWIPLHKPSKHLSGYALRGAKKYTPKISHATEFNASQVCRFCPSNDADSDFYPALYSFRPSVVFEIKKP